MKLNLEKLLLAHIDELGGIDPAADFFGETSAFMKKVKAGKALNWNIVNKLLGLLPEPRFDRAEAEPVSAIIDPDVRMPETTGDPVLDQATLDEGMRFEHLSPETLELVKQLRETLRVSDEAGLEEVLLAITKGAWKREVALLFPSTGQVGIHTMFNVLAMMKKCPWLGFFYKANTTIQRARNVLAQRFLASDAEWSLWMDSDMILPFGDPGFMRERLKVRNVPVEFAKIMTPHRLRKHGRTIVGGVYAL